MSTVTPSTLVSDAVLEELAARAEAIYEGKLKTLLEPEHNNEFVAIHVDTEDYAVAPTFREAKRIMLARHPIDGKVVVLRIGLEPEIDGLAARLLASDRKAAQPK